MAEREKKSPVKCMYCCVFLYISLIETSVSFTANSVVRIFFYFHKNDRNLSFGISSIHLDKKRARTGLLVEKNLFLQIFLCK